MTKARHTIPMICMILSLVIAITASVLNLLYNKYPSTIGVTDENKDWWALGTSIGVCAGVFLNLISSMVLIRSQATDSQEE